MKGNFESVFKGIDATNRKLTQNIEDSAPKCHFRKMFLDQSDITDGYYEMWWECSVCGHTKDYNLTPPKDAP